MNYLTKKNFGIPTAILCAVSVLLGYALYSGSWSLIWVVLAFAGITCLFDFEDAVKENFKQAVTVALYGWVIKLGMNMLYTILEWFSDARTSTTEGIRTTYKVFSKILEVANSLISFLFIVLFILMMLAALKGSVAKLPIFGKKVAKDTVPCPKCGAPVEKDAAFCTKCGNKMQ